MLNSSDIRKTAISGLLIAMDVLLTRVLAINTPLMKIGLGFFAVAVCGELYGPVQAAVCAALGDLLGSLLFPTGAYYPGFTLTAALTGIIFGLLLHRYSRKKAAAAAILNVVLITFFANTAMIARITGTDYLKLLGTRAIQIAVMLPIQLVLLAVILPLLMKRLRKEK